MSAAPPVPRASGVFVWVPLLVVAGALVVMVKRLAEPLTNPDTYFHLRLGEEFLGGWSPWAPGSVTVYATADWAPTQWLSQVLYAVAEDWFGLPGVVWLSGTVVIAFIVTAAVVAQRFGGAVAGALVTALAVFGCLSFLSARPQVASYLLVLLFTASWLRSGRGSRLPWWTVPATWIWAMLHGMWVSGILVGLAAALGLTLDRRGAPAPEGAAPRPALWKVWSVPLLGLAAAGLTVVGPSLYPATSRVGGISQYFAEWRAPEFTSPTTATAALMLALVVLIALRSEGRQSWLWLMMLSLAAAWMLYAHRSVPVAVSMLVPLLAASLGSLTPARPVLSWHTRALVALGVAASAGLACLVPFTSAEQPRHDSPASAAAGRLPAGTGLLTDWGLGGTDMWLFPDLDIVMHGYGDMFTDAELARNSDIVDLMPGWDRDLRELKTTHALIPGETPLAYALVTDHGWQVVAQDPSRRDDESGDGPLTFLVAPDGWLADAAGSRD
ncbi:hypothetical protein [Nocardioides campestrisoli]|uniref:hypothetical protein n=1 Tax=Nocardioides campestrisoli TaxID=2736757 RepID=UPI00163DCE7F|nr:hypothetical protein [Nocardioides campestrisoli]